MASSPVQVQHSNTSEGQTQGLEKALEGLSSLEHPLTHTSGQRPLSSSQCLAHEE